ncbi:hypothetical protein PybrP1_001811 [[Pythium] brassicae (nom. inval.)]|nr:hypothetical protein PybrP1_001811 [[Pythium] brassicae (nom. inval.)]
MLLRVSRVAVRIQRAPTARCFASIGGSDLPDGWEQITRKNGDVVFYHAGLRKTVRHLPGYEPPPRAAVLNRETRTTSEKPPPEPNEPTIPHAELVEQEHFIPIDFDEAMKIDGHESQVVHIELQPQQCLRAETGAMIYMTDGVEMETTTAGGLQQGMKRLMTGENFFVSKFVYRGQQRGHVALGTSFPSKILRLRLSDFVGGSIICQKGAFLCGSDTVNIEMRLAGSGDALVRASGALIERELEPGEVLRISSGCLVAFEPSVHYDITMMKGVKNVLFGGEGLFVTTLTGPGKIFLQSLPFDRVVGELASRIPSGAGGGMMFPFMMGGGGGSGDGGQAADSGVDGAENAASLADAEPSDDSIYGGGGGESGGGSNDDLFGDVDADASESTEEAAGGIMDLFDSFFRRD